MPLPLNPDKYREPSIFKPQDFLEYMRKCGHISDEERAPEAVILSYQKSLFDYVVKNHPVRFHSGYFKPHMAYLEETGGRVAIVGRFGVGAPAAAVMLEELIAYGVGSFVSIGTAGGLVKGLFPGAIVLCSGALRDEGVSYHYVPGGGPALPDETLSNALGEAFDSAGVPYRPGLSWTTDAIYRETKGELDSVAAKGAITVEMEASALFAVARYREAPMAACFTISDSLAETEWRPEFLSKDTNEGLEKLYRASVAALNT
ncbi:MAG: nucleoside phosphorylase [Spirochaetes bacterium]|nr:nucleoside phosphorylase [Spirochaetota bacterium]